VRWRLKVTLFGCLSHASSGSVMSTTPDAGRRAALPRAVRSQEARRQAEGRTHRCRVRPSFAVSAPGLPVARSQLVDAVRDTKNHVYDKPHDHDEGDAETTPGPGRVGQHARVVGHAVSFGAVQRQN
jgi:hypothetical protein